MHNEKLKASEKAVVKHPAFSVVMIVCIQKAKYILVDSQVFLSILTLLSILDLIPVFRYESHFLDVIPSDNIADGSLDLFRYFFLDTVAGPLVNHVIFLSEAGNLEEIC